MVKNVTFLLSLLFISTMCFSQNSNYEVFYIEGDVFFSEQTRGNDEEMLTMGKLIPPGGNIRLTEDSKVIIFGESGDLLYLETMGTYSYDSLQEIQNTDSPLLASYLEFIWEELKSKHADLETYSKDNLKDKGGVTRSSCTPPEMVEPAYAATVTGNTIQFMWDKKSDTKYKIVILDRDYNGNILFEDETKKDNYLFSTSQDWFTPGETYFWSVYPKDVPNCATFAFKVITDEQFIALDDEINGILSALDLGTGIEWIIKASYYEKNNLYTYANDAYKNAMNAEPGNAEFKNTYGLFLARIGKVQEAEAVMR